MASSAHLTEDEIEDYARLRKPPAMLGERVQAHVRVCPACREALRETVQFVEAMRRAIDGELN